MHTLILNQSGNPVDTKIGLRTRLDNEIDNVQPWWYSQFEWNTLDEQPDQFEKQGAKRTSEANPVYNCHGLTFANRRTQVDYSFSTISRILADDGFNEIPEREVRPGDVVVYYDSDGNADHSGIVIAKGDLNVPIVWSKWGKGYEVIHALPVCPYGTSDVKFYRILRWKHNEVFVQNL